MSQISVKQSSPRYLVREAASGHLSISRDKLRANARACTSKRIPPAPTQGVQVEKKGKRFRIEAIVLIEPTERTGRLLNAKII